MNDQDYRNNLQSGSEVRVRGWRRKHKPGPVFIGLLVSILAVLGPAPSVPASLAVVENGRARAVVVTADDPVPIARLGVKELVDHIALATGVELEVVRESDLIEGNDGNRIFIGRTEAAARAGLNTDSLSPDAFVIRKDGNNFYILGREDEEGYRSRGGHNGTLYGVYEMLERALAVRWLWPGELGTQVPARDSVHFTSADQEEVTMKLQQRNFRTGLISRQMNEYQPHIKRLAFSPEGLENYYRELQIFMRRHRLGISERVPWVTHHRLWQRWGERHPEWFKLNPDGERVGPTLCVTNPDLHRAIVEEYWNGESEIIMLGEADRRTYCHCDECLAWDEPQPEDWPRHVTSNRYARFAATIRDLARDRNPDADFLVTIFIYMDYFHAPTIAIDLSGVHAAFCPWFSGFNPYYPMPEEAHQRLMETWLGWHKTGISMHYRPNYLLGGYVMPHLSTWQSGEMFRFVAEHANRGIDYDSLYGQWAAKGPMLYMLMRLAADPGREVADLRTEYFSAFGPAAEQIEEYFDYWEAYSLDQAAGGGVTGGRAHWTPGRYPPDSFLPAEILLEEAYRLSSTHDDPIYSARVEFIQAGLEHARLAAEFTRLLEPDGSAPAERERFAAARQALLELIAFRRSHEHLFIDDYTTAAAGEARNLEIDILLDGDLEAIDFTAPGGEMSNPWRGWYFCKDPDNVGVREQWFVPDLERTGKGLRMYDHDGRSFAIDRDVWTPVPVPMPLEVTEIGDYLGYGWYVTTFVGPEEWAREPVEIHFARVDEQAWVYVNGEYVGEKTVASEGLPVQSLIGRPFSVKVPAGLIAAGEENLLAVRIHSASASAGMWMSVGARRAESASE